MATLQVAQNELNKVEIKDVKTGRVTRIKLSVRIVLKIVRHLDANGSIYQLYQGPYPVAAVNTIRKIRDAWKAGALDGVIEIASAPEVQELLENQSLTITRSNTLYDAVEALRDTYWAAYKEVWEWDLRHLQQIGFKAKPALRMLQQYDELHGAILVAQSTWRDPRGLETYISVIYAALFKIKFPRAHLRYVNAAAQIYTRGLLESGLDYRVSCSLIALNGPANSGIDMLRYQIWDGVEHTIAYFKALERYKLNPKRIVDLKTQITQIESSTALENLEGEG